MASSAAALRLEPLAVAGHPWEPFADAVLQRRAALCRLGLGLAPRDLAGMYVDHADVDRILATLPGLDGPAPGPELEAIEERLDEVVEEAWGALAAQVAACPVLGGLAERCALTEAEVAVLVLVAAVELHPDRQRLVAYLQDSVQLPRLTVHTLGRLSPGRVEAGAVAPWGRLRRAGLIELVGEGTWASRMVALPERLAWALVSGSLAVPEGNAVSGGLRVLHASVGEPVAERLLLVRGADAPARRHAVGQAFGSLLVVPEPPDDAHWPSVLLEAALADTAVLVEADADRLERVAPWIDRADHLRWALSSAAELPVEFLPDVRWTERAVAPVIVCGGHRQPPGQDELVRRTQESVGGDLDRAIRRIASGRLGGLARRTAPTRGWDDLVVRPADKRLLQDLAARYRHRDVVHAGWGQPEHGGIGIVALFAGPSGTGKSLAAEVVAGALGLDLYRVDLSAIVSKYIGETEKNLERVFDAAGQHNLVLFFDEADALFGKRSEVGDAHDRYANVEAAYLLQRLEEHDGLVILATNLLRNIDQAFMRRIHVAVEFPLPDVAARRQIWARSFPPQAPLAADLDLDDLAARFEVSGGIIRNAALTAAFLAAGRGREVDRDDALEGVDREYQKLGRLRNEERAVPSVSTRS